MSFQVKGHWTPEDAKFQKLTEPTLGREERLHIVESSILYISGMCVYVRIYIYICMHVCMYICIHIYIYT